MVTFIYRQKNTIAIKKNEPDKKYRELKSTQV